MTDLLTPQQIETERMRSLAVVFARANTTLVGRRIKCSVDSNTSLPAPAFSVGDEVTFNYPFLGRVQTTEDIIKVTGLNFHELAHAEYTPRKNDDLTKRLLTARLWRFFNMLEDQRIEYLFTSMYPATEPYFVSTVMNYIAGAESDLSTAHVLTYGRKYLPKKIRQALRDNFDPKFPMDRIERIIDEFRLLVLPRDDNHAFRLVEEFAKIIKEANAQHMQDPFSHDKPSRPDSKDATESRDKGMAPQIEAQQSSDPMAENDDKYTEPSNSQKGEGEKQESGDDGQGDGDEGDEAGDEAGASGDGDTDDGGDDGGGGTGTGEDGDDGEGAAGGSSKPGEGDADGNTDGAGSDGDSGGEDGQSGGGDDDGNPWGSNSAGGGDSDPAPTEALTKDQMRDMAKKIATNARNDQSVVQDAKIKQHSMQRVRGKMPTLPKYGDMIERLVPSDLNAEVRRFKRGLQRLVADADPGWDSHKASGRVNVSRAMRGEDLDTVWDQWNPGKQDAADIEAVICVDASTSMGIDGMEAASQAAWVIKRSIESIGGRVTTLAFSNESYTMQHASELAKRDKMIHCPKISGTQPIGSLRHTALAMHYSQAHHKIVIILTDGLWTGQVDESEEVITALNERGVITAIGYIGDESKFNELKEDWEAHKQGKNPPNHSFMRIQDPQHKAQMLRRLDDAHGMTGLANDIVKRAMKS